MAGEQLSNKVSIQVGDGATTEVFADIPGVAGIPTFPALTYDDIEVTALDSTGKEYISGLGDGGEITLTLNLRKKATGVGYLAVQQQLEGYAGDGNTHNFKVKIGAPISRMWTFGALVKSFKPQATSANSAITAAVILRISGGVVIA